MVEMTGFTEFRAASRTNRVRILIIIFLITSRLSCSKVQIPPHYSRQILIKNFFIIYSSFFPQVQAKSKS